MPWAEVLPSLGPLCKNITEVEVGGLQPGVFEGSQTLNHPVIFVPPLPVAAPQKPKCSFTAGLGVKFGDVTVTKPDLRDQLEIVPAVP